MDENLGIVDVLWFCYPDPMVYDDIAAQFRDYVERRAATEWHLGYPSAVAALGPLMGKRVLDFGCGSGRMSCHMAQLGAHVTGIDASTEMIGLAKGRNVPQDFPPPEFLTASDLEGFGEAHFDAALATFVLCTIPDDSRLTLILKDLRRVLVPGSPLAILHSNWDKSNGTDFRSFTLNHTDLHPGTQVQATLKGESPLTVTDTFRPIQEYVEMLTGVGFTSLRIDEPVDPDGLESTANPPFYIISALA